MIVSTHITIAYAFGKEARTRGSPFRMAIHDPDFVLWASQHRFTKGDLRRLREAWREGYRSGVGPPPLTEEYDLFVDDTVIETTGTWKDSP